MGRRATEIWDTLRMPFLPLHKGILKVSGISATPSGRHETNFGFPFSRKFRKNPVPVKKSKQQQREEERKKSSFRTSTLAVRLALTGSHDLSVSAPKNWKFFRGGSVRFLLRVRHLEHWAGTRPAHSSFLLPKCTTGVLRA